MAVTARRVHCIEMEAFAQEVLLDQPLWLMGIDRSIQFLDAESDRLVVSARNRKFGNDQPEQEQQQPSDDCYLRFKSEIWPKRIHDSLCEYKLTNYGLWEKNTN